MKPYPFQQAAIDDIVSFFETAKNGDRRLYASPTGTGKSVVEKEALRLSPDCWLVTPRVEIIAGIMSKMGEEYSQELADKFHIITPIRFRNGLLDGRIPPPSRLIFDEAHHETAQSWQDILLLCGNPPAVGLTATPYRGSPRSTVHFRKEWGDPVWIITLREAAKNGYLSVPKCRIEPLLNDDEIEVKNGEFVVESANRYAASRLDDVRRLVDGMYDGRQWDKATIFSVNSVETAYALQRALDLETEVITGGSTYKYRQYAFHECRDRLTAIIQINVVSEGVDFPFERLIDLAPTLSPVRWMQQLGRITRPGGGREYICCCRNFLRFAYLLEGLVPPEDYAKAAKAFPDNNRSMLGRRVFGLEAVGRFKGEPLPLADGTEGIVYALSAVEGNEVTEYAAIVTPLSENVIWAKRGNRRDETNVTATYGRWRRCDAPEDVSGFSSFAASAMSEKQALWWKRSAKRYGLDPEADVNRRNFAALPILCDLGVRLR